MGLSDPIPGIPLSDAVPKAARACAYGLPSRQTVPMPCQTDKARNNAGKWPRFERTVPTPPTIGGMPGFFENEASRPDSGDPGAKPGSERSMPAAGRPSVIRTSRLSVLDPCRSAAGSHLLIPTVSRTCSRTRERCFRSYDHHWLTYGQPRQSARKRERTKEIKNLTSITHYVRILVIYSLSL